MLLCVPVLQTGSGGDVFRCKDLTLSSGAWGLDGGSETGRGQGKATGSGEVLGGPGVRGRDACWSWCRSREPGREPEAEPHRGQGPGGSE